MSLPPINQTCLYSLPRITTFVRVIAFSHSLSNLFRDDDVDDAIAPLSIEVQRLFINELSALL